MKEWEVSCEWCGMTVGEPCVNNINGKVTATYTKYIHIPRARLYDKKHGLDYHTRRRLTKDELTFKASS